jgi:hypothetical protein
MKAAGGWTSDVSIEAGPGQNAVPHLHIKANEYPHQHTILLTHIVLQTIDGQI